MLITNKYQMSIILTINELQVDCIKNNKKLKNNTRKMVLLIKTNKLFIQIWTMSNKTWYLQVESSMMENNKKLKS